MITHLPASERITQPWKNGGGLTRQVAVFPADAGMDDFLWRVSMAEVTEPGPFSVFAGINRNLTILSGRLQLDLSDRQYILNPGRSLDFDGGTPIHATPLSPVTDLNVMTRQGQASAEVRQITSGVILPSDMVILLVTAPMTVTANGQRYTLQTHDALMFEGLSDEPISTGEGYLIAFH